MAGRLHQWWRAGEEGAVAVYRKDKPVIVFVAVFFGPLIVISLLLVPRFSWVFILSAVAFMTQKIAEQRIAVIFTPSEVIYRPVLGELLPKIRTTV